RAPAGQRRATLRRRRRRFATGNSRAPRRAADTAVGALPHCTSPTGPRTRAVPRPRRARARVSSFPSQHRRRRRLLDSRPGTRRTPHPRAGPPAHPARSALDRARSRPRASLLHSTLVVLTRFASVYPLVTARALAREFTYEVPDEVGPGTVVEVRFGNAKRRGVVTEVGVAPPDGVKAVPVERVVEELPRPLVELALWVADYYGSTPARAFQLVAPVQRKPRGQRDRPAERDALPGEPAPSSLSESQEAALARIVERLDAGESANFLLYGATGSGKTEVYLQTCAAALERGRGSIVLVPGVALTPQALGRFRARFGERIAVLHSALTEAERRDERARIAHGDAPIVLGARSAVFAPVPRLGVICVDEEHDASYKQESDPRYHARTVAAKP